jgi:hypothetical protein
MLGSANKIGRREYSAGNWNSEYSQVQAGKQLKALLSDPHLNSTTADPDGSSYSYHILNPFALHCIASQENPAATWTCLQSMVVLLPAAAGQPAALQ